MPAKKHVLVIGAGSVGKRHLRNLASINCDVSAVDPRKDRLGQAMNETKLVKAYDDLGPALKDISLFDGVVVASPPKFHVQQCAEMLQAGLPVLLEKPVATNLAEACTLLKYLNGPSRGRLLLGYTYRWWLPLQELRKHLFSGEIGVPLHARFVMSAHLADWHPWERYQEFFMSSKDLGGGALLDESHFIDLMIWLFGMPDRLFARVEQISKLEIETDDNVDILAMYENGLRVAIHLDLFGRPHEKYISVTGTNGTIRWSFEPNRVQWSNEAGHVWQETIFDCERNDMFIRVAKEFLDMLNGGKEISCNYEDGLKVLQIVEACRTSSVDERIITLSTLGDADVCR